MREITTRKIFKTTKQGKQYVLSVISYIFRHWHDYIADQQDKRYPSYQTN